MQALQYQEIEIQVDERAESAHPAPWELFPYQLVSWWEMQQFSALAFYVIGSLLETLKSDCLFKAGADGENIDLLLLNQPLDEVTAKHASDLLRTAESNCRSIGMEITAGTILDVQKLLEKEDQEPGIITYLWLVNHVKNIQSLIRKEMSGKLFVYLSPERAKFWPSKRVTHLFGEQVYKAFPSTFYDIGQAGVCLAITTTTACVFHLMRVLEITLGVLGQKFGVSLTHTNWAPAIEQIESRIREMHKDPAWKALPDCKEQQEFYAQAASHFGVLKDAWRNYTMHSRGKYTEQEAEQIFNSVKAFTQKLAERISE